MIDHSSFTIESRGREKRYVCSCGRRGSWTYDKKNYRQISAEKDVEWNWKVHASNSGAKHYRRRPVWDSSTLAANLAVAGALCAAFAQGGRFADDLHIDDDRLERRRWMPGCGRTAAGWSAR